jgi:hypothetical protein
VSKRIYLNWYILDVTRIESKSFSQNLEKINIVELLEEILEDFKNNQKLILEKGSSNKSEIM